MLKEESSTYVIKCPNCGKHHVFVAAQSIPRISYLRCDFCRRNIPLEFDKESDKFTMPKEYRMTEIRRLEMQRLM
jgi:transposase-like protein